MATGGSDSMSEEIVNIKCCICVEENRTREGEKYCIECKNYYCSSCVEIHKKIPHMKGHRIMEKADIKPLGPEGSLPSYPTQRCPQHKLEVLTMFCKDHDQVACGACVVTNHKSCSNVVFIPEQIESLYKDIDLNVVKQKTNTRNKDFEEIKTAKENKVQELKTTLKTEIEAVEAFRQELQAVLESMAHETIKELEREFSRIEESLTSDVNEIKNFVISENEALSELKKSKGNKAQEFICMKSLQVIAARAEVSMTKMSLKTDEQVYFKPEQSIKTFLQQRHTLGGVFVESPDCIKAFSPKDSLYKVKQQTEIDVKVNDDQATCSIWGSCITSEGSVLLADRDNSCLKLLDLSQGKVSDKIELQAAPNAVCTINRFEAAVTMSNQSVQFVSLGYKMAPTRTLEMAHRVYGIAHKDGKLFISDEAKTVYIYGMNGQELRKIMTDGSGEHVFQDNQHIAIGPHGNRVFVADYEKGLVVLDGEGNYLSTNNSQTGCRGVCTNGKNVFVCSSRSKDIVQFENEIKLLGNLGRFGTPLSLCFDRKKRRIVVSLHQENDVVILELE